jgi:transposase InsO family protein
MSGIIAAICTMLGIEHKISSAYNPQTNGKIERFNRILSESLKMIVNERNINFNETNSPWDLYLPFIAAAHNNKITRSTGRSPNELVLGNRIKLPHQIEINDIEKEMNIKFKGYLNNILKINN